MIDFTSPSTIGFLQFLGLGFLGVVAAFGQWVGKRKENAQPPPSRDVMIPSIAVADSQAIMEQVKTLRDATQLIRDRSEFERAMLYEAKRTNDYLEDIKHSLMVQNRK